MIQYTGQKSHFDLTISAEKYENYKDLWKILDQICKKFWFQKEKGEKGFEHWQCRIILQTKVTSSGLITGIIPLVGGHWSLTSEENMNNARYVTKNESRIEGPYSHETRFEEIVQTQDIKNFIERGLLPWHEYALEYAKSYDERNILAILNEEGNCVKTRFLKYLCYIGIAAYIPILDSSQQIMQFMYGLEVKKCYVFNIPRAMKQDGRALAKIFAALENAKDGIISESRYYARQKFIECPQIIVVLNHLPELDMLSPDRWKIMDLKSNGEFEIKSSLTVLRTFTKTTKNPKNPENPGFLIKKEE